jgi:hypothetical protein
MTIANRVTVRIEGQHGSISNLVWEDVPPFAVITGVNGAGKSQLLEVLAHSYGALRPREYRTMPQSVHVGAQAHIDGETFAPGEVYHSYGEWTELSGGQASESQVREAISALHGDRQNPWFWQMFASRLGGTVAEAQALSREEFFEALTPGLLWAGRVPELRHSLSVLFLAYRLFERVARERGLSPDQVQQRYGEPP